MPDKQRTILVVEDDPDSRDFVATVLEDHGYAVVLAADGNEAVARLEEKAPDLVTLDITMPQKSGVSVYRTLKEDDRFRHIPVIMVTGISDDFKQFVSSRRHVPPPEGYLSKPVEPSQLAELVGELLAASAV